MALFTLCDLGNLECILRNLRVWSTFSLSLDLFSVVLENFLKTGPDIEAQCKTSISYDKKCGLPFTSINSKYKV